MTEREHVCNEERMLKHAVSRIDEKDRIIREQQLIIDMLSGELDYYHQKDRLGTYTEIPPEAVTIFEDYDPYADPFARGDDDDPTLD